MGIQNQIAAESVCIQVGRIKEFRVVVDRPIRWDLGYRPLSSFANVEADRHRRARTDSQC